MRRKLLPLIVPALLGLGVGAALTALVYALAGWGGGAPESGQAHAGNETLYAEARTMARAIYEADFAALSALTHPETGCLFAPFSTVDAGANPVFTPAQVLAMGTDTTEYVWGSAGPADPPVTLTPAGFFRDILQIRDFAAAPCVGFDLVLRSGNAVENVLEEYPSCHVVDLYCPAGKDPAGTDWASLKLVLADYDGDWKLVAVVRSVYTEQ